MKKSFPITPFPLLGEIVHECAVRSGLVSSNSDEDSKLYADLKALKDDRKRPALRPASLPLEILVELEKRLAKYTSSEMYACLTFVQIRRALEHYALTIGNADVTLLTREEVVEQILWPTLLSAAAASCLQPLDIIFHVTDLKSLLQDKSPFARFLRGLCVRGADDHRLIWELRAERHNIDPENCEQTLREWLNGSNVPTLESCNDILDALGMSHDAGTRQWVLVARLLVKTSLVPAAQVKSASIEQAEHSMPTPGFGNPCGTLGEPFISKCATESPDHADAAGELLNWIYPGLMPPAVTLSGRLVEFDQSEFINAPQSHSMNDTAWIYVPADCFTSTGCRIHVALHGCLQYPRHEYFADGKLRKIGKTFVEHAGYNRWADTNRIVVLYPQANARPLTPWEWWMPWRYKRANPKGCWDWWGYDGDSYDTRDGTQIQAIHRMIDRLTDPASR